MVPRYSPRMSPAVARLEVVAGRALGMSILLDDELLIGRHADGAGRLADDEEISRSHARISLDRSGFCAIEDLGSTNGTFVNGLRITGPQTLSVGDTVEVGGTTLVVRELPIPASERSLKAVPPQPTVSPSERPSVPAPPASQATPLSTSGRSDGSRGSDEPATARVSGPPTAPAPPTETKSAPGPSSLSLRLHIDFAARTATVAVDDGSDPLQLEFDGGAWRPAASS
jgi:pSer/pThr/pTyr-binding forkhead associated (FHA) protein